MSLLIKNAKLVKNSHEVIRHILIEGKTITRISTSMPKADNIINADFNYVIPGCIDAHVHVREPGMTHKEDFFTASKAAAAGGITTILDMPNNNPATISLEALDKKRHLAKKSIVNYGFHFGATSDNIDEINKAHNIASIKVFMGSSTGSLLVDDPTTLEKIFRETRKLMTVHAEDEETIKQLTKKYSKESNPNIHPKIRNNTVAAKAVNKAIRLAKHYRHRLHILHVSTKEELSLIRLANTKYVTCETTPHHLFMTKEMLDKKGNLVKMNPPLRSKVDNGALWHAVKKEIINIIATDHAPHLLKEKQQNYWKAPAGIPGLETMLPLLLNSVNEGRLTMKQIVRLTSNNPAAIFAIKNKGMIKAGYDGDLTIVDMNLRKKVSDKELFTKCGWSPFSGLELRGWPVTTIVNGSVVYNYGKINNIKANEVKFDIFRY